MCKNVISKKGSLNSHSDFAPTHNYSNYGARPNMLIRPNTPTVLNQFNRNDIHRSNLS